VDTGTLPPEMYNAMKDIMNGDASVFHAMTEGNIPMMSMRGVQSEFMNNLQAKVKEAAANLDPNDPQIQKLSKHLGMAPVDLVKGIYNLSSKALWLFDDSIRLTLYRELSRLHPDWTPAMVGAETNRHIASYRPNYKMAPIARAILENPLAFMFSRYHQFMISDFYHNMKGLVAPEAATTGGKPVQGKSEEYKANLGRVVALAAQMTIMAPLVSAFMQSATGDKRYRVRGFGAMTLPTVATGLAATTETGQKALGAIPDKLRTDLLEGPMGGAQAIQRLVTPNPMWKPIIETMTGNDTFSGRPLTAPQILAHYGETLAPIGQAAQIYSGQQGLKGWFMGQMGMAKKASPASQIAIHALSQQLPKGPITDKETARVALRVKVQDMTNNGADPLSPNDLQAIKAAALKDGLDEKTVSTVIRNSSEPATRQLAEVIGKLQDADAAMGAWRLATKEEKTAIRGSVEHVLSRNAAKAHEGTERYEHLQELKQELAGSKP